MNNFDRKTKIDRWLSSDKSLNSSEKKARAGLCEGIISIVVNFAMFGIKFISGQALHSHALIADAFHSLSDSLSSLTIIIGLKVSSKPPDQRHPFGYGSFENFITCYK